ncbi:ATP-grasp domain-containing protein [Hypomontagnella monticulosa]|nr:ATP-grasp domain-containing protein [Hypomontagnella monticulosa]
MGQSTGLSHAALVTKLSYDAHGSPTEDEGAPDRAIQLNCTWSGAVESSEPRRKNYTLLILDVNTEFDSAKGDDDIEYERSDGLRELLATIRSSTPLSSGSSWSGRVLVVVPAQAGYLSRTDCFQGRFVGCKDLGILRDRTKFGKYVTPIGPRGLRELLDNSVLMLIRPSNAANLSDEATAIEEIHARISFQWIVEQKPESKTLVMVDAHFNLVSYLPLFQAANALGVKVVVMDRPGHWISEPSFQHLYEAFIPIDMTPDANFHVRIAEAARAYGRVDGICAIATYCLAPVARASLMLGLSAESPDAIEQSVNKYATRKAAGGGEPTTLANDVADLKIQIAEKAFIPRYPLILKPCMGAGSAHVRKVTTDAELIEGVRHISEATKKKVLIEAYIDGPELDVNFILLDGEILFFEVLDDFPSPGDDGSNNTDFWESTDILPSRLPENEYTVVREALYQLLLKLGLRTGVYHLEARVENSSMAYTQEDGVVDLRENPKTKGSPPPKCFLVEVNPRTPGYQSVYATRSTYGVNMYDAHVLASLGDHQRLRAFSTPFESHPLFPNHARAWSQLVFRRADKGGICASDDVCGDTIKRLSPSEQALVTEAMCCFGRGDRIPDPEPGAFTFAAFFVSTSRKNYHELLRVTQKLQREFSIPLLPA